MQDKNTQKSYRFAHSDPLYQFTVKYITSYHSKHHTSKWNQSESTRTKNLSHTATENAHTTTQSTNDKVL